jgi:hypothetical protein
MMPIMTARIRGSNVEPLETCQGESIGVPKKEANHQAAVMVRASEITRSATRSHLMANPRRNRVMEGDRRSESSDRRSELNVCKELKATTLTPPEGFFGSLLQLKCRCLDRSLGNAEARFNG